MSDTTVVVVDSSEPTEVEITGTDTVVVTRSPEEPTVVIAGNIPPSVDPNEFFRQVNLFSELDTPTKKHTARENLELNIIDGGTFN